MKDIKLKDKIAQGILFLTQLAEGSDSPNQQYSKKEIDDFRII